MSQNRHNTERYRVRREVLSRKIDRFYELHDQLAPEDPGRAKILDQIDALEIAYNVEE
jgi:hypothetical protein